MSKVTLKPGDYVRTEGMTEEQYHAVAKAFMAAGAGRDEYPCRPGFRVYRFFGWSENNTDVGLCHWRSSWKFGSSSRELTIDQILGTEPDADGWIEWHGGECPVDKGALVDVRYRDGVDGMAMPALTFNIVREDWRVCVNWKHENNPGDIIAYRLHKPKQEQGPMTIEQLLAKANKHAAKAQEHREKAAKHERKVDEHEAKRVELVEQARKLMPGYTLEISAEWERDVEEQPTEDMTDPSNWKAGDVVESTRKVLNVFSEGVAYVLASDPDAEEGEEWMVTIRNDDEGDECYSDCTYFRWISRPQGETK